jgi:hypothetical protein
VCSLFPRNGFCAEEALHFDLLAARPISDGLYLIDAFFLNYYLFCEMRRLRKYGFLSRLVDLNCLLIPLNIPDGFRLGNPPANHLHMFFMQGDLLFDRHFYHKAANPRSPLVHEPLAHIQLLPSQAKVP